MADLGAPRGSSAFGQPATRRAAGGATGHERAALGAAAREAERTPVGLRDRPSDGEPQPGALPRMPVVEPHEPFEDAFAIGVRDARAAVGHRDLDPPPTTERARRPPSLRRVADAVVEQVQEQLPQHPFVAARLHVGRPLQSKGHPLRRRQHPGFGDDLGHELVEVEGSGSSEARPRRRGPRERSSTSRDSRRIWAPTTRRAVAILALGATAGPGDLDGGARDRHRRAQLVDASAMNFRCCASAASSRVDRPLKARRQHAELVPGFGAPSRKPGVLPVAAAPPPP